MPFISSTKALYGQFALKKNQFVGRIRASFARNPTLIRMPPGRQCYPYKPTKIGIIRIFNVTILMVSASGGSLFVKSSAKTLGKLFNIFPRQYSDTAYACDSV